MNQSKLKIGIIGCGNIAFQKHLPSLARLNDKVSLIGFCDIHIARAKLAKEQYGSEEARVYSDYRKLLEDTTIDVIHVLTPNVSHAEISIASLRADKHVLCEKPMAVSSEEAKEMVNVANETGKKLSVAYQHRFRRDSLYLHDVVQEKELGEIYVAKAHAVRRRGVPTWGVFLEKEKQGGGALIDIGTHALDLTLWLMDNYKPKMVVGTTYNKLSDKSDGNAFGVWDKTKFGEVEESAFGFIKMENGATIILESAWAINMINVKESQVTLCGTEAGAEMFGNADANEGYIVINSAKYNQLQDLKAPTNDLMDTIRHEEDLGYLEASFWVDAILHDKKPMVSAEQAYVVTQILEAIYQSAKTNEPIYF